MNQALQLLRQIGLLTAALIIALSANFTYGSWTNPPAAPPADNVDAPVNVGIDNQTKLGNITAWRQKAGNQMWSPEYCDETGSNCVSASDLYTLVNSSPTTYSWSTGSWSSCSGACGTTGTQSRSVTCRDSGGNVVADSNCSGSEPSSSRSCTNAACSAPTPVPGCTDPGAHNYDSSATTDDGSCTYAPAVPSGLGHTCESNGTQVTVYWNPVSGADGYNVNFSGTNMNANNSWLTINMSQYTPYSWSVQSKNDSGPWSDMSNIRTFTCP